MARVTVEDCLEKIPNRFELILVAAKRARQLARGGNPFVQEEKDKVTVLALREIADGFVGKELLEDNIKKPELSELFQQAEADLAKTEDMEEIKLATTQTVAETENVSLDETQDS